MAMAVRVRLLEVEQTSVPSLLRLTRMLLRQCAVERNVTCWDPQYQLRLHQQRLSQRLLVPLLS